MEDEFLNEMNGGNFTDFSILRIFRFSVQTKMRESAAKRLKRTKKAPKLRLP